VEAEREEQTTDNALDAGEPEGSGKSVSPMAALAGLCGLSLDTGSSPTSPANTPGNSPAASPQAPFLEHFVSAPPSALKTQGVSKSLAGKHTCKHSAVAPTQHSAGFLAEALGPLNLLTPEYRPQGSHGEASLANDVSDDRMSATRMAPTP
jgi:hypothetical protein